MNTTQPIEAKPTGPSGKIWGLWQGEEIIADAMHQDEAEHFARMHNQSLQKKPETFEAHGLIWIGHVPGDPMPCPASASVRILCRFEEFGEYTPSAEPASSCFWGSRTNPSRYDIIGWNYAEAS